MTEFQSEVSKMKRFCQEQIKDSLKTMETKLSWSKSSAWLAYSAKFEMLEEIEAIIINVQANEYNLDVGCEHLDKMADDAIKCNTRFETIF